MKRRRNLSISWGGFLEYYVVGIPCVSSVIYINFRNIWHLHQYLLKNQKKLKNKITQARSETSTALIQPVNIFNFPLIPGWLKQRLKIKEGRKCNFCHPKTCHFRNTIHHKNNSPLHHQGCFSWTLNWKGVSFQGSKVFRGENISMDCLAYFGTVKDNTKSKHTDLPGSECEEHFIFFPLFCCKSREMGRS